MKQTKLLVTSIQRGCVNDGPGVRTTIFLHGCLLRCPWCCNPETWSKNEVLFNSEKCLKIKGIKSQLCSNCKEKGGERDISECPLEATKKTFTENSDYEILKECLKDESVYNESNGGVTFSGGEPLLQIEALEPVLEQLTNKEIAICFETTLVAKEENIKIAAKYANHIIVDIKLQPQMMLDDDNYVEDIKHRLSLIKGIPTTYRLVFVDEMTKYSDQIISRLKYLNIQDLELLKAHNLGKKKYIYLHIPSKDYSANTEFFNEFSRNLSKAGIKVTQLSI